jgi:hypothetical protein
MKSHSRDLGRAAALAVTIALLAASPAAAEKIRNHFDSDGMLRPPGFFEFTVVGGSSPARWLVLSDRNPPSAPSVVVQVESGRSADSVAAAVRRTYSYRDGTTSAFVRSGGSRIGLVVRYADEKNHLLLLIDASTGETVLTSVRDGKGTVLGHGKATFADPWQKVTVVAAGPSIRVSVGDAPVLEATDPHPVAGRAGLAAAGPGEARFDELILDSDEIKSP